MFSLAKMSRALSAMASKLEVARARMVGPAPERQMPSRPGCDSGVISEVTAGRPGIFRIRLKARQLFVELGGLPVLCDTAGERDLSSRRRSILDLVGIVQGLWSGQRDAAY